MPGNGSGAPGALARFLTADETYQWRASIPLVLGTFLIILDANIVNVALPHMMASFGSNLEEIQWVSIGYLLASSIMMPTSGFLGDRFGRKRLFAICLLLFTLTSVLCGLAWSAESLVFFRVLQGGVGGAIVPVSMALLFEAFPPWQRGMGMALAGIGNTVAPILGPSLGGFLVDGLDWRWIFFINLPIGLLGMGLAVSILRESNRRGLTFDAIGFVLMGIALSAVLLAVSQGNTEGWYSDWISGLFVTSAVAFAFFLITQFWRREPIVDLRLYQYPTYAAGTAVAIVFGLQLWGGVFLLPVFLQTLMGYDAIQTGLILAPAGIAAALAMPVGGALCERISPKLQVAIGMSLMALTFFGQSTITPEMSTAEIVAWTTVRGLGIGITFPALNQTALGAVPIFKVGQASGLFNLLRQLGGAFGIAVMTTLLIQRQVYHAARLGHDANAASAQGALAGLQQLLLAQGSSTSQAGMQAQAMFGIMVEKQAAVLAFQDAFVAASVTSLFGILPALFMARNIQRAGKPGGAR